MTNEQYSNMMIAFAKLEAKVENLQAAFSELLEAPGIENKLGAPRDIKPEDLSNFWNEDRLKEFGCIGDNSTPPKPFFNVEKEENVTLCIWETLLPEQRTKPMGLVCPCKKCTPYSM